MAWGDVLGQAQPLSILRRAIVSGRLAHAYLFHGPEGVGKCAAALAFARVLLCRDSGDEACGNCTGCKYTGLLQHPDLHVLFPQPTDATQEEVGARLQALAQDPYAVMNFARRKQVLGRAPSNKQAFYPIDRIKQELRTALTLHAAYGGYRVVVLTQADTLGEPAANAFLKFLEEPGDETVLILTTTRTEQLLPTIVSRCQQVRFAPLDESSIAAALVERRDIANDSALLYARMAEGSYTVALDLASQDTLQAERKVALEFLGYAYMRHAQRQMRLMEQIIGGGRDHVLRVLDHALVWIRDLLLWQVFAEEARITNIDRTASVAKFASRLGHADLDAMARLVEEGRFLVRRNMNLRIVLIALSQAVGQAMRRASTGKLYVPLA